jgi:hypothetical protein
MRWSTFLGVAALGCSGASAASNSILGAKFNPLSSSLEVRRSTAESVERRNATTPHLNFLTRFLNKRQAGRCGPEGGGASCTDNQCCSSYGWCGLDPEHCGEIVGCQPEYGRCGDAPPIPSTTSTPTSTSTPAPPSSTSSPTSSAPLPSGTLIVSPNGQCGNSTGCMGSGFGNCCSEWYWCGNGPAYCGTGCRSAFGSCGGGGVPSSSPTSAPPTSTPAPPSSSSSSPLPPSSTSSSAAPTPTMPVSTDGRCGDGVSCTGSTFGRCCSDYYWCGNEVDYCSIAWGCRPEWGSCGME